MIKSIQLNFIFLVCMPFVLFGQHEGDQWVIGYYGLGDPNYSIMHINFDQDHPEIEYHYAETMQIRETSSNICDKNGEAILWTNGMQIFGKNGITVADTISFDDDDDSYWKNYNSDLYGPLGFLEHEGTIILPLPNRENEFEVLYHTADTKQSGAFAVNQFLEARVKYNEDSTYKVLFKDRPILPKHEWFTSRIIACRHGNGRDWWVITFEADSPYYYIYILDPNGIRLDHKGQLLNTIKNGIGQAVFSNYGNYIARTDRIYFDDQQNITLFSFDRCTGVIVVKDIFHTDLGTYAGVAFSPDEHFLYGDNENGVWQWDLQANDVAASQTLIDTFDGFVEPGWYKTTFGPMGLAPDGRIYITCSGASSKRLHVIDRPNLFSPFCRLLQRFINLDKWNGRSSPNLPNYRLGPLDGSPCDTLGLNNIPVAKWRYEEDQPGFPTLIRFTDQSFFDPHEWHWDFDDGSTSDTASPLHTFEPGLYHVCLTVSNEYATDSVCRWVEILPTDIRDEMNQNKPEVIILPNPFQDQLLIQTKSIEFHDVQIQLYDMYGRMVFNQPSVLIPSKIFVPDFPPGLYLCVILEKEKILANIKLMKIDL